LLKILIKKTLQRKLFKFLANFQRSNTGMIFSLQLATEYTKIKLAILAQKLFINNLSLIFGKYFQKIWQNLRRKSKIKIYERQIFLVKKCINLLF
jgi:hypothetical protein